ncbi:MAG: hypothetical protein V2A70_02150 [Candidatus Omnitrophota bacterium]
MTYNIGDERSVESVTLVNASYRTLFLNVFYDNKYVYGDLDDDGLKDAAVITEQNSGGSGYCYVLNFLINDGEMLVHKASRRLEGAIEINRMSLKNGRVYIDMDVRQGEGYAEHPSRRVKKVYEYADPDVFVFPVFCS